MNNYIIKNENGEIITNTAERNIILLRYASFLNENNQGNIGFPQVQMHQVAPELITGSNTIVTAAPLAQTKKSTKTSAVQNSQQQGVNVAVTNQKLSG